MNEAKSDPSSLREQDDEARVGGPRRRSTNSSTSSGSDSTGSKGAAGASVGGRASTQKKRLEDEPLLVRAWELLYVLLPAGCYAFGGAAGIAVFQELFVRKHGWVNNKEFADLLALGNALPGPTTTIMAVAVGVYRAGLLGAVIAFLAWSLPSLAIIIAAGMGMSSLSGGTPDWMAGLAPAAVVLIFVACIRLGKTVVRSQFDMAVTVAAALAALFVQDDPSLPPRTIIWFLPLLLVLGGLASLVYTKTQPLVRRINCKLSWPGLSKKAEASDAAEMEEGRAKASTSIPDGEEAKNEVEVEVVEEEEESTYDNVPVPRVFTLLALGLIIGFSVFLAVMHTAHIRLPPLLHLFGSFFIVGITVYGGGQVILPVLISVCVKRGWISMDQLLEGFALVQMLPGPNFNLGGYVGAIYHGLPGALVGWLGLSLPCVLLTISLLPLWDHVRKVAWFKVCLVGVNCAALGLILSVGISLYMQVVNNVADAVVTVVTAAIVGYAEFSSLSGVIVGALIGYFMSPSCLNIGQFGFPQ